MVLQIQSIFIHLQGFFQIATDISEDPNCLPKHRQTLSEKLYFILFVKQVSQQEASEDSQLRF